MVTTFDGQGLGGFDLGLNLENLNAELAAYFQTPEGQANLAASGLNEFGNVVTQPDFTQQINDAYAPKYGYYTPDVGGTAGTGGETTGDGGETVEERIARLDREQRDASDAASALARTRELDFARESRPNNARDTLLDTLNI